MSKPRMSRGKSNSHVEEKNIHEYL